MKAIETVYKGYRFRSRLEARWAVYLDVIGWQWDYEPEGFEFADGTRYLPDFKVNCSEPFWIEVKGPEPSIYEMAQAEKLVEGTKLPLVWAVGLPTPEDVSGGLLAFHWEEPTSYNRLPAGRVGTGSASIDSYCHLKWNRIGWYMGSLDMLDSHTVDACLAAKQARFEFGQKGVVRGQC